MLKFCTGQKTKNFEQSKNSLMEIQIPPLVIAITFILSLSLFWFAKKYIYNPKTLHHKLPPGPWKLPLIGNLHQLASSTTFPPHHVLKELAHKYGPLMHLQLGEISAVVISSPNMAKQIMKTHDLAFANRPKFLSSEILAYGSSDIAFAPYGDHWRQMRKICMLELLSVKKVQSFSHIREDEVAKLIGTIQLLSSKGATINLSNMFNSFVSTFVSRAVFGNISEDEQEFLLLVKEAIEISDGFDVADLFPSFKPLHLITGMKAKLEKMHKQIDKIAEKIIRENQEKKGMGEEDKNENLVEVLLRVQKSSSHEAPITINNVKAVIWDIFAAGTDTSAKVLEWCMSELIRNPVVMEKAQAEVRQSFKGKETIHEADIGELNYLKEVIRETLRLHPPLPLLLPRECREGCKIDGYDIPIKTRIMVNTWALGRDPQHWYDAEKFIPERFHGTSCIDFKGTTNFEYLPFGAGRRVCPGISFGLANVEFALGKLLYHFNWKLPQGMEPQDLDMDEAFGLVAGRKNNLCLIPTPFNPSTHDNGN